MESEVSAPVRYALLALVAVLLLAVRVAMPTEPPLKEARFDPFPVGVVAKAPALPQYAVDAHERIEQQLGSANAMWAAAFGHAGVRYDGPILAAASRDCGRPGQTWAGIYCPKTKTMMIDVNGHVARHQIVGSGMEDLVLGYVVAHEVGHHVQTLRGAPDEILRRELHADCLAGVWGKAAGLPLPPAWMYGEDAEHGTAMQRIRWLNEGYRDARPAACNAVWTTPSARL